MARLSLVVLLHLVFTCGFAQTGKLVVNVKGIQRLKGGEISTGIFASEDFLKVGRQLLAKDISVTADEMMVVFDKVPVGVYAVVSFQDIDKNKQLKSNFVGYPIEPVGFSRDAKIKFGPPDFDDASITIEADKTLSIMITLK